jgi:hypothetical protein
MYVRIPNSKVAHVVAARKRCKVELEQIWKLCLTRSTLSKVICALFGSLPGPSGLEYDAAHAEQPRIRSR